MNQVKEVMLSEKKSLLVALIWFERNAFRATEKFIPMVIRTAISSKEGNADTGIIYT
ncbi:MAG: hypothetical protein R2772_11025 [Chitinophagales bacterium]